jgi:hypothetical protein
MLHCSFAKADLRQLAPISAMVEGLSYWATADAAVLLSINRFTISTRPQNRLRMELRPREPERLMAPQVCTI